MGVRGLHSYLEDSQTGQVYDLTFYGTNSGKSIFFFFFLLIS